MTLDLSLGEIDALCAKAARGAGFSWGMAQEVGRAARTLAMWGAPWAHALAQHLSEIDGAVAAHAPRFENGVWTAAPKAACPLCLGVTLMDFGHTLGDVATPVAAVRYPILLLPFLSAIAASRGGRVGLASGAHRSLVSASGAVDPPRKQDWPEARIWFDPEPMSHELLHAAPTLAVPTNAIPTDALAILEALAHRTYVPESEESRAAGAGAGTSDND